LFEDVFESAIVLFEDGVFSGEIEGVFTKKSELEAGMSEFGDRFIGVVHTEADAASWEVENIHNSLFSPILWSEHNLKLPRSINHEISTSILIPKRVSPNNNGLTPSRDESRDILNHDRFSEDSSSEIISNRAIGGFPHLFELEFFDSDLVGGDRGAFDADFAFFDGFGGIEGDLVVGLVPVFHSEIEIEDFDV